jgi:hypothetical protein
MRRRNNAHDEYAQNALLNATRVGHCTTSLGIDRIDRAGFRSAVICDV